MARFSAWHWQLLFLVLFCAGMVCFWMLPVLFAGYPPFLPGIDTARDYLELGMFPSGAARLTALLLAMLHGTFPWDATVEWTWLNTCVLGASVFVLWWLVRKLFDSPTAWVTIVIYALLPLYWVEALKVDGYALSLLFVFTGGLLFAHLHKKHLWMAAALAGLSLGLAVAARDAFILFVPWACLSLLWLERSSWKQRLIAAFLCGALSIIGYLSPLVAPMLRAEDPVVVLLDHLGPRDAGLNHLYPDDYTYEFDREAYDAILRQRAEEGTFLERRETESYRLLFGVDEVTVFARLKSGLWVLLNQIPSLILVETVGGVFLWLFILPGFFILRARKRPLLLFYVGLLLFMECIMRFGLFYTRSHLMDVAWGLAIAAAVGVVGMAPILQKQWKRLSAGSLIALMTIIIAVQLVQANRKQFAQLYAKSDVPAAYAATEVLATVPEGSVVAHPNAWNLFLFKGYDNAVMIHSETVERFSAQGRLREPFEHYKVTHIIGYSPEDAATIRAAIPRIQVLTFEPETKAVTVTPFLRYVLHLVR